MKTLLCLAGCISSFSITSAQSLHYPNAPLFAGNGAYSVRFNDLFSFSSNTASLANCLRVSGGVYGENKFGLSELNSYTAAAQMPAGGAAVGLITTWAGSSSFNQSQIGFAYGKQLGRINLGVRFNYTMMRIAGYGSDGAISFELGSIWKITEKLCTGIQITNPVGGKFGKDTREKLPTVYSMGAGYECSSQLFISTVIAKEESKPLNLQAAVQYLIGGRLLTMFGLNSAISSPLICAGWLWKNMRVLMSGSFHPQLGPSTGIGIIFYGKKKEESL
jgi:hypothetical protein